MRVIGKSLFNLSIFNNLKSASPVIIIFWVTCYIIYLFSSFSYMRKSGKYFNTLFWYVFRFKFSNIKYFIPSYFVVTPLVLKMTGEEVGFLSFIILVVPSMIIANGLGLVFKGFKNSAKAESMARKRELEKLEYFAEDLQYATTSKYTSNKSRKLDMSPMENTRTDLFSVGG